MSKTKKIKRQNLKIKSLQSKIDVLEWSLSDLAKKAVIKLPSRYYTPRPDLAGGSPMEREEYCRMLDYVYKALDNEYRRAEDFEEDISNLKFIVYMSKDVIGKMGMVDHYQEFKNIDGKFTFREWEVVVVQGRDYVHFVRVY